MDHVQHTDSREVTASHVALIFAAMACPPLLCGPLSVKTVLVLLSASTLFSTAVLIRCLIVPINRHGLRRAVVALLLSSVWWLGMGAFALFAHQLLSGM